MKKGIRRSEDKGKVHIKKQEQINSSEHFLLRRIHQQKELAKIQEHFILRHIHHDIHSQKGATKRSGAIKKNWKIFKSILLFFEPIINLNVQLISHFVQFFCTIVLLSYVKYFQFHPADLQWVTKGVYPDFQPIFKYQIFKLITHKYCQCRKLWAKFALVT